jgi:hypothetical protein
MSELMQKAYNTIDEAFLDNGRLMTQDVPPELLAYLREGLRNVESGFVSDGNFPFPLPKFLESLEVQDNVLSYGDLVRIEVPAEDFDAGDIPEIEYESDPFLDVGPMSSRRYNRLKEEMNNIFGYSADRTTGVKMEMNIPENVQRDPLGADFTGQPKVVADE